MNSHNNERPNERRGQACAFSDVPGTNCVTSVGQDEKAPHRTARLHATKRIGLDTSQHIARSTLVAIAPAGTPGEAVVGVWILHGSLLSDWALAIRLSGTRKGFSIGHARPDASFAVSPETSAATVGMLAQIEGLYKVPFDLIPD